MTYENEILRWIKQSFRILLNKIQVLCFTAHLLPKTKCNWDELDESFFIYRGDVGIHLFLLGFMWMIILAWPYYRWAQTGVSNYYCEEARNVEE